MTGKEEQFNQQAFRDKIRMDLEEQHRRSESRFKTKKDEVPQPSSREEPALSAYLERFIKEELEEEIYSQYPEFIRCENHLSEVRWLTPLDLEKEIEFYAEPQSKYARFRKKYFKRRKTELLDSDEIKAFTEEYRAQIENDAQKRIAEYKIYRQKASKKSQGSLKSEIYLEELDRFYKDKPAYKKYRNHNSEVAWMTKVEFESQEEFFEEVLTTAQIFFRRAAFIGLPLFLIAAIWFSFNFFASGSGQQAWLLVNLSEERGHLYVDQNLALGFKAGVAYPIAAGEHEIAMIHPDFIADPHVHLIQAGEGDTIRIDFRFTARNLSRSGMVHILAPYGDASIFANGEFRGTLDQLEYLSLPPGDHTLIIEKKDYSSDPPQQTIKLSAGDTVEIAFRLIPKNKRARKTKTNPLVDVGFIEVHSNIDNAMIFLDGQKTEFETDYVLQRIPFGKHFVSISKNGYKSYPEERVVVLNKNQKRTRADFTLTSTTKPVTIRTVPVDGLIFLNGKQVGVGNFSGSLPFGEHKVSFGSVSYYKQPPEQIITVSKGGPVRFVFDYKSSYSIRFSPEGVYSLTTKGSIAAGYILEGINFISDKESGPEIQFNEKIKQNIWRMGFAFEYRNPPGTDALVFSFNIPDKIDLSQEMKLKLWGYKTSSNFPLAVKGDTFYRIIVNNSKLRNQIQPHFSEKEIGEEHYDEFVINHLLRKGLNHITISTTEDASAFFTLWKVSVE